jgi:hypothetical protein
MKPLTSQFCMLSMATGKPAFSGKSLATLIAAILTSESPPITQVATSRRSIRSILA